MLGRRRQKSKTTPRMRAALKDEQCAVQRALWIRNTYKVSHEQAVRVQQTLRSKLGLKRVKKIGVDHRQAVLAKRLSLLACRHVGLLVAVATMPVRAVHDRYPAISKSYAHKIHKMLVEFATAAGETPDEQNVRKIAGTFNS